MTEKLLSNHKNGMPVMLALIAAYCAAIACMVVGGINSCLQLGKLLFQLRKLLPYGVGDVYLVYFAREVHAPALHAHPLRRYADGGAVGRNLAQNDGVCRNSAVVSDLKGTEHLCARADEDVVANRRMALAAVLAAAGLTWTTLPRSTRSASPTPSPRSSPQ